MSISESSPLIGTRLDDPIFAELYSAVVVGIRPIGHLAGALQYAKETAGLVKDEQQDFPQAEESKEATETTAEADDKPITSALAGCLLSLAVTFAM